jgi:hypothetical protein
MPGGQNSTFDRKGDIVTDLPAPGASRLRPPRWRDARLLVGILLVLASVTLGSYVVAHADDRSPVYAAAHALVPGQPLGADDLVRVDVQLGGRATRYLPATGLAPDRFVLREVAPGELVPASAVGGRDAVQVQPLTLVVDAGSAATLHVGTRVDVYVNPVEPGTSGATATFTGPELALEGVSVAGLPKTSSGLGASTGTQRPVQVMAPTERVKEIIGAVDLGAKVTLVPVAGSGVDGAS